jgi:ATP-binding cassette subfamily F protein uup
MPLFRLNDIQLAYGTHVLLDHVSITIQPGERWGLLGRNGAGKTTFLKLLSGKIKADGGEFWTQPEIRVAYLDQELPPSSDQSVYDYIADGLASAAALIKQFHHLIEQEPTDQVMAQLEQVQREIDTQNAWSVAQKIESVISILQLPAQKTMAELSGGWARRAWEIFGAARPGGVSRGVARGGANHRGGRGAGGTRRVVARATREWGLSASGRKRSL